MSLASPITPAVGIDGSVVDAFTLGDCWWLASRLNQRFGFQLVFAVVRFRDEHDPLDPEDPLVDCMTSWRHALVRLPDLRLLDIEGPGTSSKEKWVRPDKHRDSAFLYVEDPRDVVQLVGGTTASQDPAQRTYPEHDVDEAIEALMRAHPDCFVQLGDHTL